MANTARAIGRLDGNTNFVSQELPVASGVTVTKGDFVYFASGRITSATIAGARLVGQVQSTATGNSGGSVKALVIIDRLMRYVIKNDNIGTTFAASHVGSFFDLVGASGSQLVDTSTTSATDGQLACVEYNPQIDPIKSDTTYGTFVVAEFAYTSTS